MGAVIAAQLASAYPRRVRRAVLLDPPILSRLLLAALALMPSSYRRRGVMASKARARATAWPSRYAAFDHLRSRPAFARVPDDVLWDYVHAGTLETGPDQVALLFPPELEVHLNTVPANTWRALGPRLAPLRLVRGTASHVLSTRALRRWARLRPADELIEIAGAGHLLPFERPALVAQHIARD
jgi:pimeloyl-ACP methyl ester carboxylesterase